MSTALTQEEQDFERWMEEVDLEEVNLLDAEPLEELSSGLGKTAETAQERERRSGESVKPERPKQRGVGWDES